VGPAPRAHNDLEEDLVFQVLAARNDAQPVRIDSLTLARLPSAWPDDPLSGTVLRLGCAGAPAGLYAIGVAGRLLRPLPPDGATEALLPLAGAAVVDEACAHALTPELAHEFTLVARHGTRTLWVRPAPPSLR
jgi:hypothetical protein